MSTSKTRASSSSSVSPDYLTGAGIDDHAIEVRSKLHPFTQKNRMRMSFICLIPHWFWGLIGLAQFRLKWQNCWREMLEAPLRLESTSPWLLTPGLARTRVARSHPAR
ncbi:unnamed protein product [Prunus brigantina]